MKLSAIIDFIDRHTPHDARFFRVLDLVLPVLITGLLVISLIQIGRVGDVATEARDTAHATQDLARDTQALAEENQRFGIELREGLVEGCRHSGNRLRKVVRTMLHGEVEASKQIRPSDLPGISPHRFHRLVREGNEGKRKAIRSLHRVACRQQYPRR